MLYAFMLQSIPKYRSSSIYKDERTHSISTNMKVSKYEARLL
jgi:hypothetical protein